MIDRPMKQVSLRAFRDRVADLRETVEVSRRDPNDGTITVLGVWTPYKTARPQPVPPLELEIPVEADSASFRVIGTPAEAATVVRPDPRRAVPKPSQRSRR